MEGTLTGQIKNEISQLCTVITHSTNLLLGRELYREASYILRVTGSACKRLGERLVGVERQECILRVSEEHIMCVHVHACANMIIFL